MVRVVTLALTDVKVILSEQPKIDGCVFDNGKLTGGMLVAPTLFVRAFCVLLYLVRGAC